MGSASEEQPASSVVNKTKQNEADKQTRLADLGREPPSSGWSRCYTCLRRFAWHGEQVQGGAASLSSLFHTKVHFSPFIHAFSTCQSPALCLAQCWGCRHTSRWIASLPPGPPCLELKIASCPEVGAPRILHMQDETLLTRFTLHTFNTETSTNSIRKLHLNIFQCDSKSVGVSFIKDKKDWVHSPDTALCFAFLTLNPIVSSFRA